MTTLVLLAPVLAAIAIALRLDGPGPVIVRQVRPGRNGAEVRTFVFRTARTAGPGAGRVGTVLRRTGFDQLPQLLNVLNGTMTAVEFEEARRTGNPRPRQQA